jgi:hypothetical protein
MADQIDEAGNKIPGSGDPSQTESHPPESDSRGDHEGEPEDWKRKYLEAKQAEERANRLEREVAALKERLEQPPAAPDGGAGADDEADWDEVRAFAAKGDPVAKALLKSQRERDELVLGISIRDQLRDIPDPEERARVRDHWLKNRNRLGDIKAARSELREESLGRENEELKKRLEAAAIKRDPDTVRTDARGVPASEHKQRTTFESVKEFRAEVERLKKADDFGAAMLLQQKVRRGEIAVKE